MLEQAFVTYAYATLASLKLGSIFMIPSSPAEVQTEWSKIQEEFTQKGLSLQILKYEGGKTLLYLFRSAELMQRLKQIDVCALLRRYGYDSFELSVVLQYLQTRIISAIGFPHEIGVFLGYPMEDVVGFIENNGKNCLCCGCWKVYANPVEAEKSFARIHKCREIYGRLFASGCPLSQLAVATRSA
ncbi:MAG: DUF3793 family protein [Clostridia bacterium]|nr:DUF3793 family protein [Clostridia bacterium]